MELRVDTASCELHVAKSINLQRVCCTQPLSSITQGNQSTRSEGQRGSYVTTVSSPEQTHVSLNNPLVVKVGSPSLRPLQTAPKQLQTGLNRFSFGSEQVEYSADDLSITRGEIRSYSSRTTAVPSFTLRTKKAGCTKKEDVALTFECTSMRNAEAAEWVDALVRARGETIRAKKHPSRPRKAQKNSENIAPRKQTLRLGEGMSAPRTRLLLEEDYSLKDVTSKTSSRSNSNNLIGLQDRVDALTIALPMESKCEDGTRRALQIDRDSKDYQDI